MRYKKGNDDYQKVSCKKNLISSILDTLDILERPQDGQMPGSFFSLIQFEDHCLHSISQKLFWAMQKKLLTFSN